MAQCKSLQNSKAVGSNPTRCSSLGSVSEWFKVSVLKTDDCKRSVSSNLTASAKGNILITQIILTIVMYWMLMGIGVAAIMALFYGFAVLLGELAEWLRQRFAKPSLRK